MASKASRFVVVGGGVIGLSTAYHLARMGCERVLLLEQNELGSGTSWHAAGIVGPLRATMNLTRLAKYALKLFPELEQETGQHTGYKRTGGFWLAEHEQRLTELKRIKGMGDMHELNARLVSSAEIAEKLPMLNVSDLCGGLYVEEDGQINPYDLCMAYARGARQRGVEIREHARVTGFSIHGGAVCGVELKCGEIIDCDSVINCAGLWARSLGQKAGVSIPVQAVEHMYVVTEPMELPQPCPLTRDLKGALYIKEDAGRLVIGTFEKNARLWDSESVAADQSFLELPDNWENLEPMLEAAQYRIPALEDVGLQHFMNGPESFTPDTKQVMGESPEVRNYFVAAGLNSLGIMSSAGVGNAMAAWMLNGSQPMDLWEVDIARFDPTYSELTFLKKRTRESVSNQLDMHWPFKQYKTGRDVFRSALYDVQRESGAVFGVTAGWERPLWFGLNDSEATLIDSHGAQNWWPFARREAQQMASTVALFELSPFTKIHIEGKGATAFLNRLCTTDVDVEPGRVLYTLMLNPAGGIESELTCVRLTETAFCIVGAAATRLRDLTWLRRHLAVGEAVAIEDHTSRQAVIGVMGPQSRSLLQQLTDTDLSSASLPFGASRAVRLAACDTRCARLSFVGELGWEVYVDNRHAEHLYREISTAGSRYDLIHAGLFCMEACRLEKGYPHWGHDIGPMDSPLHAGLNFAVRYAKDTFTGKEALLKQIENGVDRRLLLFRVDADSPLLLHDEPIYRNGELAGHTTSGGLGFRTDLALSFGMVTWPRGTSLDELRRGQYEVNVAGERLRLTPLDSAPYDPQGRLVRS